MSDEPEAFLSLKTVINFNSLRLCKHVAILICNKLFDLYLFHTANKCITLNANKCETAYLETMCTACLQSVQSNCPSFLFTCDLSLQLDCSCWGNNGKLPLPDQHVTCLVQQKDEFG